MTSEIADSFAFPDKKHVRFFKDVVIKSGPVDELKIEVVKTERAYEVAQECGLFRVPQVKDFDETKGWIVFERIPDIQRITRQIAFGRDNEPLISRLAQCLAAIHQRLTLPSDMTIHLRPGLVGPEPHVFLHGDFGLDNICMSRRNELVILDWRTSCFHGGMATYGTCYFDLTWFLTNLFYLRSRGRQFLFCRPVSGLPDRFVESYLTHMPSARDGERLGKYLEQVFREMVAVRRKWYTRRRRFRLMFSLPHYKRFIDRCYRLTPDVMVGFQESIQ